APDVAQTDVSWAAGSQFDVWVWLELAGIDLVPGATHVHIELADEGERDLDVAATRGQHRLALWVDDRLRGQRERTPDASSGSSFAEQVVLSVRNASEVAREVWIEEPIRPARRRRVERAWPTKPTA